MQDKKQSKAKVACPVCGKTYTVNNVISSKDQGNNVVYRKYCRNCLVEFKNDGTIVPPLY